MLKELENYIAWKDPVVWKVADSVAHNTLAQKQNSAVTASFIMPRPKDEFNYVTLQYPTKKNDAFAKELAELAEQWMAAKDSHKYLSDDEFFSVLCEEEK